MRARIRIWLPLRPGRALLAQPSSAAATDFGAILRRNRRGVPPGAE